MTIICTTTVYVWVSLHVASEVIYLSRRDDEPHTLTSTAIAS